MSDKFINFTNKINIEIKTDFIISDKFIDIWRERILKDLSRFKGNKIMIFSKELEKKGGVVKK